MHLQLHQTDLRELDAPPVVAHAEAALRIGQRVIASDRLEAWKSCLAIAAAGEEALEGTIQPEEDILQDLAVDGLELGTGELQLGKLIDLLAFAERQAALPVE